MSWQATLTDAWLRRGRLATVLRPLAFVYGWLWRRRWQRAEPAAPMDIPVVVVGNVIAGGAGKTPFTHAVAQLFLGEGRHVGIISKGYGRQSTNSQAVFVSVDMDPTQCGDEPLWLARSLACPVVVGPDRQASIRALRAAHPEVDLILCDDGLQDLQLHRDLELVVFDERVCGNGWLLPAGPLREPWPRPKARPLQAEVWVIHSTTRAPVGPDGHAPAVAAPPVEVPDAPGPLWHVERNFNPLARSLDGQRTHPLSDWCDQPVQVLTGIAKPEQLLNMLRALGLRIEHSVVRPDHDPLTGAEYALRPELPVLVTAKDAVKLKRLGAQWQQRLWVAELTLSLPEGLQSALRHWAHQPTAELSSRHGQKTA